MSQRKLRIFISIFCAIIAQCFFLSIYTTRSHASDYSISYNIDYNVNNDGSTFVDYHIRLLNLSDSLYAASESLTLTQTDVANITVIDSFGTKENFTTTKANNATTITTNFTSPSIGSGSTDQWEIKYTTNQIASKIGNAWNILVPGFGDKKSLNIDSLNITINAPSSFGIISYSSPQPSQSLTQGSTTSYIFNGDTINASGVNMILGQTQNYQFTFNYPVTNSGIQTQEYTVAVPPDTSNQNVIYTNITPKPDSFNINSDGDYVLNFNLPGNRSSTIHIEGYSEVGGKYNNFATKLPNPINLSVTEQVDLTKPQQYWDSNNPKVIAMANSITKGDTTNVDKARSIYNYLVKNFKYNRNALFDTTRTRKGGIYALTHPNDVICQEYVDAFISLARSVGVPSVLDAGYGNTTSPLDTLPPNVLHAWAEFYDPSYGWISADPTWGSTSGQDFFGNVGPSHFVLAKYGYSSTTPALVLSFTSTNNDNNNIKLLPTNTTINNSVSYMLDHQNTINANGGIASNSSATITNNGNRVLFLKGGTLTFANTNLNYSPSESDSYIFPTMNGNVSFKNSIGSLFTNKAYSGNLSVVYTSFGGADQTNRTYPINVLISPAWYIMLIPILAVILIFMISYVLVNLFIRVYNRIAKSEIS